MAGECCVGGVRWYWTHQHIAWSRVGHAWWGFDLISSFVVGLKQTMVKDGGKLTRFGFSWNVRRGQSFVFFFFVFFKKKLQKRGSKGQVGDVGCGGWVPSNFVFFTHPWRPYSSTSLRRSNLLLIEWLYLCRAQVTEIENINIFKYL